MRLLILLTTILFTTSAIATDERNGFYVKAGGGVNKTNRLKDTIPSEYHTTGIEYPDGTSFVSSSSVSPFYSVRGGVI